MPEESQRFTLCAAWERLRVCYPCESPLTLESARTCSAGDRCECVHKNQMEPTGVEPVYSLERAYAFPRVRIAVARLLQDFECPRPASVAACARSVQTSGHNTGK